MMFDQEEGSPPPTPTMDLLDTDEELDNINVSSRPIQSRKPDSPFLSPIPFTSSNELNLGYLSYSQYGPHDRGHDRETTLLNVRSDTEFYKTSRLSIKVQTILSLKRGQHKMLTDSIKHFFHVQFRILESQTQKNTNVI